MAVPVRAASKFSAGSQRARNEGARNESARSHSASKQGSRGPAGDRGCHPGQATPVWSSGRAP